MKVGPIKPIFIEIDFSTLPPLPPLNYWAKFDLTMSVILVVVINHFLGNLSQQISTLLYYHGMLMAWMGGISWKGQDMFVT